MNFLNPVLVTVKNKHRPGRAMRGMFGRIEMIRFNDRYIARGGDVVGDEPATCLPVFDNHLFEKKSSGIYLFAINLQLNVFSQVRNKLVFYMIRIVHT